MPRKIGSPPVASSQSPVLKELFLCLLSALLLIFSFPNFNLWLLAWFGFVPLFFAIRNKSKARAFLLAYFTGIIFWLGTIYWLIHVTLPGMIVLVLYLALYFGLFGLIISTYLLPMPPLAAPRHSAVATYAASGGTPPFGGGYPLFIPSVWVLLEYLRSHLLTGFPWALLGYSQHLNLPVIQIADICGAYGVSFLVMLVNIFIYSVFIRKRQHIVLPILIFVATLVYGYYKLDQRPAASGQRPINISVVQGNIPQELKWNPESNVYIMDKYLKISRRAAQDNPDLIIWPEAALPVVLEEEPGYFETVKGLAKEIKIPLLLGAVTSRDGLYYNNALLVSKEGEIVARYEKLHLVPFGEYIPLRKIFSFLETVVPIGDFTRGKEYTIFSFDRQIDSLSRYPVIPLSRSTGNGQTGNGQTKFSVLICFEDLFPELSREFVKRGANFLVNITNDAWFKQTSSPYQHLAASVFRAVENRVFLVRSANTGVSAFIAPTGKIISLVSDKYGNNIFISGYDAQKIPVARGNLTFYSRYGDILIIVCLLFILWCRKV